MMDSILSSYASSSINDRFFDRLALAESFLTQLAMIPSMVA